MGGDNSTNNTDVDIPLNETEPIVPLLCSEGGECPTWEA